MLKLRQNFSNNFFLFVPYRISPLEATNLVQHWTGTGVMVMRKVTSTYSLDSRSMNSHYIFVDSMPVRPMNPKGTDLSTAILQTLSSLILINI